MSSTRIRVNRVRDQSESLSAFAGIRKLSQ